MDRFSRRLVQSFAWSAALLATFAITPIFAQSPRAQFDVHPLIGCRDVTTAEFRAVNRGERLIEVPLSVSVLVPPDAGGELAELLVRVESPDRTAVVVDYTPRTSLDSDIAGTMRVERREESSKSLDFHAKSTYNLLVDAEVKGSSRSRSNTDTHYEKQPPLELCVASGTVNRGFGAYFKWKPTNRTTLEGSRDMLLVLRVPDGWRGDYLTIRCEAYGREPAMLVGHSETQKWVRKSFLVALYEEGDVAARADAIRLLRAEARLREQVQVDRKQVQRSFAGNPLTELSGLLGVRDSTSPEAWWEQLVYGPSLNDRDGKIVRRLPSGVRDTVSSYQEARRALRVAHPTQSAVATRLPPVE